MAKTTAAWARPERSFPQERSRRTFEALVDAAAQVFAERGFDATQTPDIAAAAGVSVGTFYNYFADKKEIYLDVVRRDLTEAHERTLGQLTPERFADKGERVTIEATLNLFIDHITRAPHMQRVFIEMSMRDPDVAALRAAFDRESLRRLTEIIAALCPPEHVADPEATAYIIQTAVVECAIQIAGARGAPPIPRERAQAALTELVYRALQSPAGA